MEIKNILVPVDFSPPSQLAVNHGVALARALRAKLTLLHVVESLPEMQAFSNAGVALEKQRQEQAVRMLSALVASEDQDDLDLRIVLKVGDIKEEIAGVVHEQRADILVMGTHGRGLIGRWTIGSITEAILRNVPIPVLTVCRVTKPLAFRRILFATDFSEYAKKAFSFALELAARMRSDLVILHTFDPVRVTSGTPELIGEFSERDIQEGEAKLKGLAAEAHAAKVSVETSLVIGRAPDEILKLAEKADADVILIGVHRKGLVERALLGTTAEHVIRHANVPVLAIPTGEEVAL